LRITLFQKANQVRDGFAPLQGDQRFRGMVSHGGPGISEACKQDRTKFIGRTSPQGPDSFLAYRRVQIEQDSLGEGNCGRRFLAPAKALNQQQAGHSFLRHEKLLQGPNPLSVLTFTTANRLLKDSAELGGTDHLTRIIPPGSLKLSCDEQQAPDYRESRLQPLRRLPG
jgi:hypothetical protein